MAEAARQQTGEGVAPREHNARTENAGTYSSWTSLRKDSDQPLRLHTQEYAAHYLQGLWRDGDVLRGCVHISEAPLK